MTRIKTLVRYAMVIVSLMMTMTTAACPAVGHLCVHHAGQAAVCRLHGRTSSADTARWYDRVHHLDGVTVVKKRGSYSRRHNPALELMRLVVADKRLADLRRQPYCRYESRQRVTLAVNDVSPDELVNGTLASIPGALNMVEACPMNNKLILPLHYVETVTRHRRSLHPHMETDSIVSRQSGGVGDLLQGTGDALGNTLRDFFADVDIYDDQVRLLQRRLLSPIAREALSFYRYVIVDTVMVGADRCVHLAFSPVNARDAGFSGELFVTDDGTHQVRRCRLALPRQTSVNFVENMRIDQDFVTLPSGQRVLTDDDMMVEMALSERIGRCVVIRHTEHYGHRFGDSVAHGGFPLDRDSYDGMSVDYARRMSGFTEGLEHAGGATGRTVRLLKLLAGNYLETARAGRPNCLDIGPVNAFVTRNSVDGIRLSMGAQTTAHLMPRLFLGGRYTYAVGSHSHYYQASVTFSLHSCHYAPHEFPMRNVTFSVQHDVSPLSARRRMDDLGSVKGIPDGRVPSDDNILTSFRWIPADKLSRFLRQQLTLRREESFGLLTVLRLSHERMQAFGDVRFPDVSTSEMQLSLRYASGETLVDSKGGRRSLRHDATVVTISHTAGFRGVPGGAVAHQLTEASLFRRLWMSPWGHADILFRAGAEWSRVPMPLLLYPSANLSYVLRPGLFSLMTDMEFATDRYAGLSLSWDMEGRLLNRIPLVRRLKWRERVGVQALWGGLTDKNRPVTDDERICQRLDGGKPYLEASVGVHNVFRFLSVEYVRRLTYLHLPTATPWGVRMGFEFKF